ncbi:hypothetical protein TBS_12500 [Thermobispora bispora]|uniref:Uncharacterized protein n=1 Tax=Thermobispora bispora (strain ATCC 19993 / DSM 43833 / CBS 139.67 / JCM 10125 / KCTC 9307 / NBRC 14880 / R51) TaxID=469371 RepID=D6Y383_THEBD|nr:DUF1707 domain-containing protein [Thermobispora bispora]ADG88958.1 protein of unknown function DUF1707 [Thermobispora bispora DSM 43833]
MNDPGQIRVSDAEREAVVERLREASVEGRLTLAELTERTEAAYLARARAELDQLTADLPGGAPAARPVSPPAPAGGGRESIVAIMSSTERSGTWRIDRELSVFALMGDVKLDLRQAAVRTRGVDIAATCVMGSMKVIVPDGVVVELSGLTIMGDKKVDVVQPPFGQSAPVVRIHANVVMGDVKVLGESRVGRLERAWRAWTEWWQTRRQEVLGGPGADPYRAIPGGMGGTGRPDAPPAPPYGRPYGHE